MTYSISSSKTKTDYESYVHISNSGVSFKVHVEDLDSEYGGSQFLTTELHAFGIPLESKIWLDDNVLTALEYIVAKAREQRKAFNLNKRHEFTSKPSHLPKDDNDQSCKNSAP